MSNTNTPMITNEMIERQKMLNGPNEGGVLWTASSVRDAYERLLESKAFQCKASDMTLRDHFAGLAMQALIQECLNGKDTAGAIAALDMMPSLAYAQADKMLKAREQ
jgi:hypothetical protein